MQKEMRRNAIIVAAGIALLAILIAVPTVWRKEFATVRTSHVADVSIHKGGTPMVISACVSDLHGQAISGVELNFINNSGGNLCITDVTGRTHVGVAETDLEEIQMNGEPVARWSHAYLLNHPSVENGLFVSIVVKDLDKIGKGQLPTTIPNLSRRSSQVQP